MADIQNKDYVLDKLTKRQIRQSKEYFRSSDVVKQIFEIIDRLESKKMKDWPEDKLVNAGSQLSVLLINLGEMVSDAELQRNNAEMYRKHYYAEKVRELIEKDKPVSHAQQEAEVSVLEWKKIENRANYQFRLLRNLCEYTEKLVSMIQTKIGLAKTQMIQSSQQT